MIEKQFGTIYGPALKRGDKTTCIRTLEAEIDRLGGAPYGWIRIYEALLFGFYNPRTGECFPSHKALAQKARCGVRTVQRALKWARQHNLIQWAHGLVRDGWRVLRSSNRYAFAAFLTTPRILASLALSNGQKKRGVSTSYSSRRSLVEISNEIKSLYTFRPAPSQLKLNWAVGKRQQSRNLLLRGTGLPCLKSSKVILDVSDFSDHESVKKAAPALSVIKDRRYAELMLRSLVFHQVSRARTWFVVPVPRTRHRKASACSRGRAFGLAH